MFFKDIKNKIRRSVSIYIEDEKVYSCDETELFNLTKYDNYEIKSIDAENTIYGHSLDSEVVIKLIEKKNTKKEDKNTQLEEINELLRKCDELVKDAYFKAMGLPKEKQKEVCNRFEDTFYAYFNYLLEFKNVQ